jgi:hypoxanthine-guanine phosphoribosyltransferase
LALEYVKTAKEADKYRNKDGLLDATSKLKNTFENCAVNKLFYASFYSLPKFGKTLLGQKVLYAKQSQSEKLIKEIALEIKPFVLKLIKEQQIKAVCFIPPTIPRKVQFLKELQFNLDLSLPEIQLEKAYRGEILVAQKTLSKLEERVENARESIFIKKQSVDYESVLLIDDAVGSGATLNETAKKLKIYPTVKKIIAFAVVGSLKGFDIIQEV